MENCILISLLNAVLANDSRITGPDQLTDFLLANGRGYSEPEKHIRSAQEHEKIVDI
jgi:hypothetical protein